MAKLLVETFQVVLGVDVNDPSPVVYVRGLLNREDADAEAERLNNLRMDSVLDPTLVSGKVFYVRNSPGAQERVIPDQTLASVAAEVGAFRFSVPVYIKTQDDAGGNSTYVQVRVLPSIVLR